MISKYIFSDKKISKKKFHSLNKIFLKSMEEKFEKTPGKQT